MYQLNLPISSAGADALEAFFCEEYQEFWMLFENEKLKTHELRGYFADETEAAAQLAGLRGEFPALNAEPVGKELADRDWKDAYKLHFKAWSDRGLHFVPEWERESYELPAGEEIILLDPGMAFGTGNHETTRLCIHRLLDVRDRWGADTLRNKSVVDAGCGSGILAIAARKAGFRGEAYAFDNDQDSVKIAVENAALCEVPNGIDFQEADLVKGLADRKADVVFANILAPVLIEFSIPLLDSVETQGVLILSGILAQELDELTAHFQTEAEKRWAQTFEVTKRIDGQWGEVSFWRS
jgi:ribosomal protein L11 methyltransferase|tara:strand:+ start:4765 stop:5655 length:891 start_codon:yes stop_codon:yes gene_type:complete